MKTKIYFLTSSEDSTKIRYIGKTIKTLHHRLWEHLNFAKDLNHDSHCPTWVRKVIKDSFKIEITLIGEVDGDGCKEEINYITYCITSGFKLTNDTPGGEGFPPWNKGLKNCYTEETLIRKRASATAENNGMYRKNPWNKGKTGCYSKIIRKSMGRPGKIGYWKNKKRPDKRLKLIK